MASITKIATVEGIGSVSAEVGTQYFIGPLGSCIVLILRSDNGDKVLTATLDTDGADSLAHTLQIASKKVSKANK